MEDTNKTSGELLVPTNTEGKALDIQKQLKLQSVLKAKKLYGKAHHLLLKPVQWASVINMPGTIHFLMKKNASSKNEGVLELNDWVGMDLGGEGHSKNDRITWMRVDQLMENFDNAYDETLAIRMRPVPDPEGKSISTENPFQSSATSTFILKRSGQTVTVSYHGRNEMPHLSGMKFKNKLRNAVTSFLFMAGYSRMLWSSFLKGSAFYTKRRLLMGQIILVWSGPVVKNHQLH